MPDRLILPAVLEQAPIGVGVWDRELRYLAVNAHLAVVNGVPATDHLGRRVTEVLPGLAVQEEILRGVLESGEPAVGRRVLGCLPGYDEPRWRLASYFPVRGARGDILAIAAVIADVTDQVRLESAAAEARADRERERVILEQVVAQVPVGIVVSWGPEHHYVAMNELGRALLPGRGELIGRTPADVHPEGRSLVDDTWWCSPVTRRRFCCGRGARWRRSARRARRWASCAASTGRA